MYLLSKNNKYYYRIVLTLFIALLGLIITITSVVVSAYYQVQHKNKTFRASAQTTFKQKEVFLQTRMKVFRNFLTAIDTNQKFNTFIRTGTQHKQDTTELMMAISQSFPSIMQFRFLDSQGHETIRIDRNSFGTTPFLVAKNDLQNKAKRYYFQEVKKMQQDTIWFSHLDLNIEHGKIQKPIVPTLRIAKPYYVDNTFKGMLIINIFMEKILHELMQSELFHISLIDKDSHILTTTHTNMQNWSRYLQGTKYKYTRKAFLWGVLYDEQKSTLDFSNIIQNKENLTLVIQEKHDILIEHTNDIFKYMAVMAVAIFLIAFPVVILLSRYPSALHEELNVLKDSLSDKLDILDNYVYSSRTDVEGTITHVSQAFCDLSGYTREELLGLKHSIVKSNDTKNSFYQNMWKDILDGKRWTGVIKNMSKNNTPYWVLTHITPEIKDDKIIAFTSIGENITDQVHIEEISIKDELTQAYNRRHFNRRFTNELKRLQRNNTTCCIAMFDIDYFKKYNDAYGHIKGDETLQKIVQTVLEKLKRPGDYLFRIGGEEFILLHSDVTNYEEAQHFSAEILKAIEDTHIEHKLSDVSPYVTISLGHLTITPSCSMNEKEILQKVDMLLYESKHTGRNKASYQVC